MPPRLAHRACAVAALLVVTGCGTYSQPEDPSPSAGASPSADADEGLLLPDLTTLPASSVQMDTSDGTRALRFGTTLANTGVGPLEVVPLPEESCPAGQRAFGQRIVADADGDEAYDPDLDAPGEPEPAACVLFHEDHDHWHIDASARYDLQDLEGTTVVAQEKVSFCLRDTDRVPGEPATVDSTYGECSRDRVQGISPGWGDLYDFDLGGQALELPDDLADGTYCLVMTADPFDLLRESDEDDNTSVTDVRIAGGTAERAPTSTCADGDVARGA